MISALLMAELSLRLSGRSQSFFGWLLRKE